MTQEDIRKQFQQQHGQPAIIAGWDGREGYQEIRANEDYVRYLELALIASYEQNELLGKTIDDLEGETA